MSLETLLLQLDCHPVITPTIWQKRGVYLDLSADNKLIADLSLASFKAYHQKMLDDHHCGFTVGRYAEDRTIYRRHALFNNREAPRTVHLGVDLNVPVGTDVYAPIEAIVHSFKDNTAPGDYGPTVILQHQLQGMVFFTLYGHLCREDLKNIKKGQVIQKGQAFAHVGSELENGQWPSHLHFQIIKNIGKWQGDYPGVATRDDADLLLDNSPDPNLILKLDNYIKQIPAN